MIRQLHPIAGVLAFAIIATFWCGTVWVELMGNPLAVYRVKTGILWGMLLLVPSMAAAGATGFKLGGRSRQPRVLAKRRRMPFIALNGLLILVPCAVWLQRRAAAGQLDDAFFAVQAIELVAGAVNLTLMGLSLRDGLALRRTPSPAT